MQPGLLSAEAITEARILTRSRRPVTNYSAQVFVVANPAEPGLAKLWCAALQGALLADPLYFTTNGVKGVSVKYISPLEVEKLILVSNNFNTMYPELVSILQHAMGKSSCTWRRISGGDWLRKSIAQKANRARFVGLVTPADRAANPALNTFKNTYSAISFIEHITKLDMKFSRQGLCGL